MLHRTVRSLVVATLALAPIGALADGSGAVREPHASEAPKSRDAERGACEPSGPLARVASVQGDVRAVGPDGSSRALACDDVVNACEDVVTGPGASAGLVIDDAIVQIGPDAQVELSARPAPELAVERGAARVVDGRDEAAQRVQLYAPGVSASTGRGDAELVREGDVVRVCAHDEPLVVMAQDGAKTVPAGSCLETKVLGGFTIVPAGAPTVALGAMGACPFYVATVPTTVPPVSSPPPTGPGIDPFDPPGRDSCDDPGSGCRALCEICEDPDPDTDCGFPGSSCGGDQDS